MKRCAAAVLAACMMFEIPVAAAGAQSQAVEPFREIPLETPAQKSHLTSYLTMAGGASLIGLSFVFTRKADRAYDAYLVSTEPNEIETLYDRAAHYDHLSQASILTGEVFVAAGLYLRFIRRPAGHRVALSLEPARCAVSFRF